MGHSITALIFRDPCDENAARDWDVVAVPLGAGLCLVHITGYYSAYWQARRAEVGEFDLPAGCPATFPSERVVLSLATALTQASSRGRGPTFALAMTDYFGGYGDQWACAFVDGLPVAGVQRINDALRVLGVEPVGDADEFDTVGLADHRHPPDYLDRYVDLCGELGV